MILIKAEYMDQVRAARAARDMPTTAHVARCCFRGVIVLVLAAIIVATLPGCTVVRYTDGDTTLTVLDTRITGSAIDLSGTIDGVGSLDVNREQGGTEGVISEVGDIVKPSLLP